MDGQTHIKFNATYLTELTKIFTGNFNIYFTQNNTFFTRCVILAFELQQWYTQKVHNLINFPF